MTKGKVSFNLRQLAHIASKRGMAVEALTDADIKDFIRSLDADFPQDDKAGRKPKAVLELA